MPADNKVGREVARLRAERGMSQKELAEAAGVTEQALSRIENGVREPRLETLRHIAVGLRVDVGGLLEPGRGKSRPRKAYRPEVEKLADLLADAPHDTVVLARKLVEVLLAERRRGRR